MSLNTIIRSFCSLSSLAGAGMIAMGLGAIEVDPEIWSVATAVIGESVPARPFLLFLGSSKVLGVLGLWGLGLFPKLVAYAAVGIPAVCAVYGHLQVGHTDKAGVAGVYVAVLSVLYYLENSKSKGKKE